VERGEDAWIAAVARRFPRRGCVLVGIGDDVAAVSLPSGVAVLKVDTVVDGVDVRLEECGPEAAGRKAVAVTASDLAASGSTPVAALVSVVVPRRWDFADFDALAAGVARGAEEAGCDVVGGDTSAHDGPLVVTVAMTGEPGPMGVVRRSGARPGDALSVTGPLGGSILGRHLAFRPRLDASRALVDRRVPHAMTDLSDGLLADLPRLCAASGCGADVEAERVPVHDDVRRMPPGAPAFMHALGDGEDFELVFAVSPVDGERLLRDQPVPGLTLAKIGECVESGLWLEENGQRRPLEPTGWVHEL
jgi:thiamine-monophosphate kinase